MFEMSFKSISESEKHMQSFVNIYLAYILKHVTAAFSELCRFPLLLSIITGCINFWLHMMQSDNKALISKAYLEQYNSSPDKSHRLQFVENILHDLGVSHVWNNQSAFNSLSIHHNTRLSL